jgi:hypothetical protein
MTALGKLQRNTDSTDGMAYGSSSLANDFYQSLHRSALVTMSLEP